LIEVRRRWAGEILEVSRQSDNDSNHAALEEEAERASRTLDGLLHLWID